MPLNIYLLYYLLWGISQYFLLLGRVIIGEWDFKPNVEAQILAPTVGVKLLPFIMLNVETKSTKINILSSQLLIFPCVSTDYMLVTLISMFYIPFSKR